MITVAMCTLYDLPGHISKHYIALFINKNKTIIILLVTEAWSVVYMTICMLLKCLLCTTVAKKLCQKESVPV